MNGWAAEVETALGTPAMSGFHAMFSLGAGLEAASGYLAVRLDTGMFTHFALCALLLAPTALVVARVPWTSAGRHSSKEPARPLVAVPRGALVLVGLVALGISLGEGASAGPSRATTTCRTSWSHARKIPIRRRSAPGPFDVPARPEPRLCEVRRQRPYPPSSTWSGDPSRPRLDLGPPGSRRHVPSAGTACVRVSTPPSWTRLPPASEVRPISGCNESESGARSVSRARVGVARRIDLGTECGRACRAGAEQRQHRRLESRGHRRAPDRRDSRRGAPYSGISNRPSSYSIGLVDAASMGGRFSGVTLPPSGAVAFTTWLGGKAVPSRRCSSIRSSARLK